MNRILFLDSGPLGLLTHPQRSAEVIAATEWLSGCLFGGSRVIVPAIVYYELRREILRARKSFSRRSSRCLRQCRSRALPSAFGPSAAAGCRALGRGEAEGPADRRIKSARYRCSDCRASSLLRSPPLGDGRCDYQPETPVPVHYRSTLERNPSIKRWPPKPGVCDVDPAELWVGEKVCNINGAAEHG